MNVSTRERNILLLAALVAAVFVLTQVLPAIQSFYASRQARIDDVQLDVAREQRLIEEQARWQERRAGVETRRSELETQIFTGTTVPLIEAAIQRDLTQYARNANISVLSTRLAEQLSAGSWLMISQEMSFRTGDAVNTLEFLAALEQSVPRLYVKDFSLDRNRNLFSGDITVVGFARSEGLVNNNSQARR
jgi:hypothetical protein